ncbi:hypothetical protein [Salinarimonas ramus]|uniref:Uncharacterized protein n=1 Tax=Salinarimonas ramus TaxID=690164 RepID=A0A917Q4U7_9HYPH|nr:hypothetical protein [Salinarimonas ramus]GGK22458.1 hypothetical protein GCM10011322_06410 [Salinarimonas ramus]
MLLKCEQLMKGPGPSEAVVRIVTRDGTEEVIVDTSLIHGETLDVGPLVTRREGLVLIELPRESVSGRMRVWISEEQFANAHEVA